MWHLLHFLFGPFICVCACVIVNSGRVCSWRRGSALAVSSVTDPRRWTKHVSPGRPRIHHRGRHSVCLAASLSPSRLPTAASPTATKNSRAQPRRREGVPPGHQADSVNDAGGPVFCDAAVAWTVDH